MFLSKEFIDHNQQTKLWTIEHRLETLDFVDENITYYDEEINNW